MQRESKFECLSLRACADIMRQQHSTHEGNRGIQGVTASHAVAAAAALRVVTTVQMKTLVGTVERRRGWNLSSITCRRF